MARLMRDVLVLLQIVLAFACAHADDIEGRIESVNLDQQSFVLQGVTFFVTRTTAFNGGLLGFVDLVAGIRVEVDFEYRDGRHYATGIELDD